MGRAFQATLILLVVFADGCFLNFAQGAGPGSNLRQRINFNSEWKFQQGDPLGAETVGYDDSKWDDRGLPHSFSQPYFLAPQFYVGYGWYRKHFNQPAEWSRERLFVEFDGVFQVAEVFVNGQRVGEHEGGYTGFFMDITAATHSGDNLLAVRVNNLWNPRLAPRAGEHVFSGGIYRNVYLTVTAPLHVAWNGVAITTPSVSKKSATVNAKSEIQNDSGETKHCTLKTGIVDPQGRLITEMRSSATIAPHQVVIVDQTSRAIPTPQLWHPDHPNLYTVVTSVNSGRAVVDIYRSPLGFRWFEFTADRGLFLNGEHFYIRGANVHQDHAGWGDAITDAGVFRDVKLVKDAGFNFIRGSHYPHHPAFADACDKLGVLFWSENAFWATAGDKRDGTWTASGYPVIKDDEAPFEQSCKDSLREMIRINRNHPSVIVWSMCNEPFFCDARVMPKVKGLLTSLVQLSRELDPTRPAAIGGCQRGEFDHLGDIAGYNGDGARLFMDPKIPNVVSEYGSTIADRPGEYAPGYGDLQQEQFPWRSGQVLWCGFDHGSLFGTFGRMGMVDYFRLPKRQWYWYRSEYRHIPPPEWPAEGTPARLGLAADRTTIHGTGAIDDAQVVVTVLDAGGKPIKNSPPVTLLVESGPGEFPTGPSITFAPKSDIAIRDGQAAMEFRSYHGGRSVIRATSPGLADAILTIVTDGSPAFVPGQTSPVRSRPYVRFFDPNAPIAEESLGRDSPTQASSESTDHPARLANDGSEKTFWLARSPEPGAWWQVDLERLCVIKKVRLVFPAAGNFRYRIETSDDGRLWRLAADQSQTTDKAQVREDRTPANPNGRYVRVTVTGLPPGAAAAISDVQIAGNIRAN